MNNTSVQIFLVRFNNEISFREIPLLRGAILNVLGEEAGLLFHNHTGDHSYRYKYPLIQYKRIRGKAAVFCIGEGVETIGQFLSLQDFMLSLGDRSVKLEIEAVFPKRSLVQIWDSTFKYKVRKWLPLNSENYQHMDCPVVPCVVAEVMVLCIKFLWVESFPPFLCSVCIQFVAVFLGQPSVVLDSAFVSLPTPCRR